MDKPPVCLRDDSAGGHEALVDGKAGAECSAWTGSLDSRAQLCHPTATIARHQAGSILGW